MNPRIAALLTTVTAAARQEISRQLAETRLHDLTASQPMRRVGFTPPLANSGRAYDVWLCPAIREATVPKATQSVQYAHIMLVPTVGRAADQFAAMCVELMPEVSPEIARLVDEMHADLKTFWPKRTLQFLLGCPNADLEMCFVFVDLETLKRAALDVGRGSVA